MFQLISFYVYFCADEMDYAALSAVTTQLTFEPSVADDLNQRRMCVNITIRNDQLLESTKSFTLSLVSVDVSRVELNPNVTEISIVYNEGRFQSEVLSS